MLKKKQNLTELEHRVCDRIDDVAKAMVTSLADKFDTTRRFRMCEGRIESLL